MEWSILEYGVNIIVGRGLLPPLFIAFNDLYDMIKIKDVSPLTAFILYAEIIDINIFKAKGVST